MKKIFSAIRTSGFLFISALTFPLLTHADCAQPTTGLQNPLSVCDLTSFLDAILNVVITIGGIFIVLMIVYTGFKFVYAQGKPEEIKEARTALFWTLLGALVLLGAKAISLGVAGTVQGLQ